MYSTKAEEYKSMSGKGISEEKARRIAAGATVAGVLLILFLIVILIVQFVQIGVAKSRQEDLDRQIDEYQRSIEQGTTDLDWYKKGEGLYWYARQNGFK